MVPEELRALYSLLESEFSPLDLCARVAPLLERLDSLGAPLSSASPVQEASLAQYKAALQQARRLASFSVHRSGASAAATGCMHAGVCRALCPAALRRAHAAQPRNGSRILIDTACRQQLA